MCERPDQIGGTDWFPVRESAKMREGASAKFTARRDDHRPGLASLMRHGVVDGFARAWKSSVMVQSASEASTSGLRPSRSIRSMPAMHPTSWPQATGADLSGQKGFSVIANVFFQ